MGPDHFEKVSAAAVAAFPKLDDAQARIATRLYRLLAKGRPVSERALSADTGIPPEQVAHQLSEWSAVYRNDDGDVIGFWGLGLGETAHRLQVGDRTLHTWCALDSLFVPELIGEPTEVTSSAPDGTVVSLRVDSDGTITADREIVMSFLAPADELGEDVQLSFCHYIYFFENREAGERWTAENEGTFLLSIEQAAQLARGFNARMLERPGATTLG